MARLDALRGSPAHWAVSVRADDVTPGSRRALQWDALLRALVCLAALAGPLVGLGAAQAPMDARELLRQEGLVLTLVRPPVARGLAGSVLRIDRAGTVREVALDGTGTGRRARGISEVRLLPGGRRAVLHLDRSFDASGLIVVDLEAAAVVDAAVGRDLTPSPDGRFWAFEEHASRTLARWPHTETVYAVYDAGAPPGGNTRPCPTSDDRCRGQVLFLPDRLALCHEIARERTGSCLVADRQPRHSRRSPFVWLSATEVAWVDVDLVRQDSTLVVATMGEGQPARVRAVVLDRTKVIEDVEFPPAREAWTIERITRDEDPSRLWLHFRTRVPQAPLQRLGVRLS